MLPETLQAVTEHMNTAHQAIRDARNATQEALALVKIDTDTAPALNLSVIQDIYHALTQLSSHLPLWRLQDWQKDAPPDVPPGQSQGANEHVKTVVYNALLKTFTEVRQPGKNALVIFLLDYAQHVGVDADTLREVLLRLHGERRITARVMDFPPYVPEAWEIVFTNEPRQ